MRVAMIGMGDIARKAYLPVLGTRDDIALSLMSRDAGKLESLAKAWRIAEIETDLERLLRRGLDAAFVHAATAAHEGIVARLLEAGVHTYVDKPLADTGDGAGRLAALAERKGVSLMVGFNRRFAPDYARLASVPRDVVLLQKHRVNLPGDPRTIIFDDFIHVIDTLRFLLPTGVESIRIESRVTDGMLHHILFTLTGRSCSAVGVMNRVAGINEEVLEVSGRGVDGQPIHHRVTNMAETRISHGGTQSLATRGDWTPVSVQRGVQQICDHFLAAVQKGETSNAQDAVITHRMCEEVVARLQHLPHP